MNACIQWGFICCISLLVFVSVVFFIRTFELMGYLNLLIGWLGDVAVRVSDLWSSGQEFDCDQVATLGKLLTPMSLRHQAV